MLISDKIYVAGHKGLVGSALVRCLVNSGYKNIITRTHLELDLENFNAVSEFFNKEQPDYVFLAAALVGGIHANNTYPAEFIYKNLAIQINVIQAAYKEKVNRLLFLGSSCIYPQNCPQPMREEYLLTGPLEPTNRPYALAKIAGIEMCWAYNRQFGTNFLAVMPTNLYGPGDNYDPENSHALPALMRRIHEAKQLEQKEVTVWGTGKPRREFMYSEDLADACIYLMNLHDDQYTKLLGKDRNDGSPPLVNIGVGKDLTIADLASLLASIIGYDGKLIFDINRPDGTPQKLLDTALLGCLGWQAKTSLEEGLRLTYRDFQNSM